MTPEEQKQFDEIAAIFNSDFDHTYWHPERAGYQVVRDRVDQIYASLYGSGPANKGADK
jgi:hypothetical protein